MEQEYPEYYYDDQSSEYDEPATSPAQMQGYSPSFEASDLSDPTAYAPRTPPEQQQTLEEAGRFSRRKLLIAGSAAGGLVVASALGLIVPKMLLQRSDPDIGGSFLRGNPRTHPALDIQGPMSTPDDIVIFSGQLMPNWNDWSWGAGHSVVSEPAFTDGSAVLKFSPVNYSGLYFSHWGIPTTGFGFLQFWVNGGSVGGQQLIAGCVDPTYTYLEQPYVNQYLQGGFIQLNKWQLVRMPLAALQSADSTIGGVVIRDVSGTTQPDVYVADIRLVHLPDPNEPNLLSGAAPDLNAVILFFDRQMRQDEVQSPRFYQLTSLEDSRYAAPRQPSSAQYHPTNKSVSLYVPTPMLDSHSYQVSVGRIHANDGPALPDASNVKVTARTLDLTIDVSKRGPAISEYIYGVNVAYDTNYMKELRPRVNRWGGTQTIRYNWKKGNCFNAGNDWYFENLNYNYTSAADKEPSGVVDQFIQRSKDANVPVLLTIPNIGWVAKDDTSMPINVPKYGAPPIKPGSDITDFGYDPTANRLRTSVPAPARKGRPFEDPPDRSDPTAYQDEWVYHLKNRFGDSSKGYPQFYAMDNEPELWQYIERDIKPVQVGYDEMLKTFLDYATAIKDVDPTAMITAPTIWGWSNYFYSSLDRGTDNFKTLADFHAHGDIPFLIWYMQQIKKHDEQTGRRTLDVLDLHFFPQVDGVFYNDKLDADGRATRLRCIRSWWDKTYKDESWIADYIYFIPRFLGWIQQAYPGTKLAISEYNWGAENIMNGALAQAEILGIMGREGLYMGCRWAAPDYNAPPYHAFKMYSNFDSQGGWFGGTSVHASSTQYDILSAYATEQSNGDVLVMILNKSEQNALTPNIHLPHLGQREVTVYRYGPDIGQPITKVDTFKLTNDSLHYTFPAYCITLLHMKKA
jgi:hypothetical protein